MAKTCIGKSCNIFYHCLSGEVLVLYPCNNYWGIVIKCSTKGTGSSFSRGLLPWVVAVVVVCVWCV